MPRSMMLVFSNPVSSAVEEEYNRWYSGKHLPDLMNVPGVVSATRYKVAQGVETLPGINGNTQGYLAVYELEGDTPEDLSRFAQDLRKALEEGVADMSPTLSMTDISATFVIPITERMVAK